MYYPLGFVILIAILLAITLCIILISSDLFSKTFRKLSIYMFVTLNCINVINGIASHLRQPVPKSQIAAFEFLGTGAIESKCFNVSDESLLRNLERDGQGTITPLYRGAL